MRQSRRRNRNHLVSGLIGAAGVGLLVSAIFLGAKVSSLNGEMERMSAENASLLDVSREADDMRAEMEASLEAECLAAARASSEVETAEPETTQPPETEPPKWETLDGVAAGTVVTSRELDMDHLEKYFQAYRDNPDVALSDLRYLKVLHYNFNHELQVGEIIVNKGLADEVLEIFREFYDAEYEIQSMHLVDNYWTGDGESSDSASIDKNNTSCFNYRPVTGGGKLSNHAYGFAIDINPQQNPYVSYRDGKARWSHENANDYIDRSTGLPHVITHEDLAFKVFSAHGFSWGGDWNNPKDYQHFEKKLY